MALSRSPGHVRDQFLNGLLAPHYIPLPVKSDSFNAQPGTDRRLVRRLSLLLCPGKPAPPAGR